MLKKVFRSMVALILVSGLVLSSSTVSAERGGTCSITIDESIHTDGVFAEPTGDCQGHIFGDYTADGIPAISGAVTRTVSHGEVVTFSIPRLGEYAMTVTLIPIEEAPEDPIDEVDKSELESKVSDVSGFNPEDYTSDSWTVFADALNNAILVLEDGSTTQSEVDAALSELTNAHDNLVEAEAPEDPVEEADKTELESKVNEVAGLNSKDYTSESWSPFADALSSAETVLSNEDATQDEVDTALSGLTNAHDNLVEAESPTDPVEEADKSELESKVNEVAGLNSEDYTTASWSPFADALSGAETVLGNEDATQDEVDTALSGLTNAHDNLVDAESPTDPVEEADKSELESKVNEVSELNSEDYTTASWSPFADALSGAETVLGNEDVTQDEVDKALSDLIHGQENLIEVEEDPVEEPKKPSGSEEKESDKEKQIDEEPKTNEKDENSEEKQEGERLPDTATDNFNILLIGLSVMLFGGFLYFFQSRRKQE